MSTKLTPQLNAAGGIESHNGLAFHMQTSSKDAVVIVVADEAALVRVLREFGSSLPINWKLVRPVRICNGAPPVAPTT